MMHFPPLQSKVQYDENFWLELFRREGSREWAEGGGGDIFGLNSSFLPPRRVLCKELYINQSFFFFFRALGTVLINLHQCYKINMRRELTFT